MRVSQALQLSIFLAGLCRIWGARPPGRVPTSHLRILSLGLTHLLQGVDDNVERLQQQEELVAAELDGATMRLESLRKENLKAGRTHKQVRKDLQIQRARRDQLWRTVRDLQKASEDLETEQGAVEHRVNQILKAVQGLTEPRSGSRAYTDISSMKFLMEKQARRLTSLASEISARERIISGHLQRIEHLEKQLSSGA